MMIFVAIAVIVAIILVIYSFIGSPKPSQEGKKEEFLQKEEESPVTEEQSLPPDKGTSV